MLLISPCMSQTPLSMFDFDLKTHAHLQRRHTNSAVFLLYRQCKFWPWKTPPDPSSSVLYSHWVSFGAGHFIHVLNKYWLCHNTRKRNFLIYKKIQMESVAKSYMRKGFLIHEERRKYLTIYEEDISQIWLCNRSLLNFLIYEENQIFFFISVRCI